MKPNPLILHILLLLALFAGACAPLGQASVPAEGQVTAVRPSRLLQVQAMPEQLARLAAEDPDALVRVIVQKAGEGDAAEKLVASLGGEVLTRLDLLNAFAAKIKAGTLRLVAADESVNWVSLDAPVRAMDTGAPPPQITLRSEFEQVDYAAADAGWQADWFELGEADGLQDGQVAIESFWAGYYQGLRLLGRGTGAQTQVDLSEAESALLSLAFRRKDFSDLDSVRLEASFDSVNWHILEQFGGPENDAEIKIIEIDLASCLGEVVQLRLLSELGESARFYLDAIQLDYTVADSKETPVFDHQVHLPMLANTKRTDLAVGYLGAQAIAMLDSSGTLKDAFEVPAYNNNNGSVSWAGDWIETDEAGAGPASGNVLVSTSYSYYVTSSELRLGKAWPTGSQPAVERQANLSGGVTGAVLSFKYRSESLEAGDQIAVQVSADDGVTYQTLEVFEVTGADLVAAGAGSRRYNISAYTGGISRVRFLLQAGFELIDEFFYIDDVQIAYTTLGVQTVREEFNSVGYSGQDGLATWSSPWVEYDPYGGNGAFGGYVSVYAGQLRFHYLYDEYIYRTVDLSGASTALLTFDWQTVGLEPEESLYVKARTPGMSSWATLSTMTGSAAGSASIDLTKYISAATEIGIGNSATAPFWEYGEYAYIDNLQVSFSSSCPQCIEYSNLESAFIPAVGANLLWNAEPDYLQGQGVTVAVVDSGIANHQDFYDPAGNSRILTHVNFSSGTTLPDDFYGHGTHVAGLIAGNGDLSDQQFMGIAPKANLVDVKVLDDKGRGYTSEVVAGLEWIYNNADTYGIQVVNLSLNSAVEESYRYNALSAALEMLWLRGVTVVVAAGNNGDDDDAGIVYPPANDPYLIVVGATDDKDTPYTGDDTLAPFSSFGITLDGHSKPDIVAPGTNMTSLKSGDDTGLILDHPLHILKDKKGNKHFQMSGTSMASPVVAGAAALLLQAHPGLTPDQVKASLVANGRAFESGNGAPYLYVPAAVANPAYAAPQQAYIPNDLLAKMAMIAYWATTNGADAIDWSNVDWESIDWEAVDWESIDWAAVNWGSVNWGSVNWGSVNWGSVNWGSVNWGSVNWGSVNWGSVNWGSVNWGSVNWGSVNWGSDYLE